MLAGFDVGARAGEGVHERPRLVGGWQLDVRVGPDGAANRRRREVGHQRADEARHARDHHASAEATRDPKTGKVWKFKGLYLRGTDDGELAVDRLLLDGRYEFSFAKRAYAFARAQFLEDEFKQIDYLFAPSGGLGYKLVETPKTTFNVDGGLGAKFEKNPGFDQRNNLVVTSSDKFEYKLSPTASVTQGFNALWQANEFGDALYTFTAGMAAALTTRTQLKVELLDTYATRPPNVEVKKNDVALLTAIVYKF